MQQFNIDISQPRGPLVLYVSQGDSLSRFFSVTVTDNGATYTPPDGAVYTVRFGAPGMPAGWYDTITEVGGGTHPAVVVDENTYTVEIAEQAVSKPGQSALVLIISDATGYTLASWAFALQVAAVPGYDAPEATVYYNALSEQVAQVLASTTAAASSATLAESWAVGGTGTREGENTNNAQYYAQQAQQVSQGALGWYATEQALQAAHPTGENGQWAIIGSTDTIWTWDSDTSAWVNTGSTAELSNYYTKEQSDTRFATAAQGTKADSAVQSVNGLPGPNPSLTAVNVGAAPAENGVNVYTHTKSGTVHNFAGTGPNGRAKMTADVQAGDTFTVNGTPVTAYMGAEDATGSMAGSAWNGKWVTFVIQGGVISFAGGAKYEPPAYSLAEQPTGERWIDGKMIYRKTYTGSTNVSSAILEEDASFIDTLIKKESTVRIAGNRQATPGYGGFSNNQIANYQAQYADYLVIIDESLIMNFTQGVAPSYLSWVVTAYYTKN